MDRNIRRLLFYVILGLVMYWLVVRFSIVIGPLIIGALLAFFLDPIVGFCKKNLKMPHNLATSLVFLVFTTTIILLVWFLTPIVIQQGKLLKQEFNEIAVEVVAFQPVLEEKFDISVPLDTMIADLENEIAQFTRPEKMFRVLLSATSNIVWILVIFVTCFFLLKDWELLRNWIISLFPARRQKQGREIMGELKFVWDTYLRGQLVMMLVIGILSGLGGVAVGLRGALYIGLLAGSLALIPSLGPATATTIAGLIAWTGGSAYLEISNFWFMILVVLIFMGVQFAEGIWLYPRIMGRRMRLHPALVFVAVVSTLAVLGALYGLIVVPIIGSVIVFLKHIQKWSRSS